MVELTGKSFCTQPRLTGFPKKPQDSHSETNLAFVQVVWMEVEGSLSGRVTGERLDSGWRLFANDLAAACWSTDISPGCSLSVSFISPSQGRLTVQACSCYTVILLWFNTLACLWPFSFTYMTPNRKACMSSDVFNARNTSTQIFDIFYRSQDDF